MRRRLARLTLLCALVGSVAVMLTPSAFAAGSSAVTDCSTHGKLTHSYSLAALQHAFAVLPADAREYTDCSDVLQRAILAARRSGTGAAGGGSGGSFLPTPVIIILVVLILAAVTFGALAIRRRREGDGPEDRPSTLQ